jgi:hypothetical protein
VIGQHFFHCSYTEPIDTESEKRSHTRTDTETDTVTDTETHAQSHTCPYTESVAVSTVCQCANEARRLPDTNALL